MRGFAATPQAGSVARQCAHHNPQQPFALLRTGLRPGQCFRAVQQGTRQVEVAALASSVEGTSSLTSNVSLGPSLEATPSTSSSSAPSVADLDAVPLNSEAGVDYAPLRDALKDGEFEKADDITRALLIELAGEGARDRGWVYFSEVKFISVADLQTLDELWKASSGGKFGYSVQKELWVQNGRQWTKFFKAIDWVQGENNVYRKWPMEFTYTTGAPKGHLPLTNALRGTRLFEAIMEHPAFDKAAGSGPGGSNNPDWLK